MLVGLTSCFFRYTDGTGVEDIFLPLVGHFVAPHHSHLLEVAPLDVWSLLQKPTHVSQYLKFCKLLLALADCIIIMTSDYL